jgi:hypothetical protein
VAYPFQWGAYCQQLIEANQLSDSRKWLAVVLLLTGISLLLQFECIDSGIPISAISQWWEAYCCYKSQNRFPVGTAEKLEARNVNGLSIISSFQWVPYE